VNAGDIQDDNAQRKLIPLLEDVRAQLLKPKSAFGKLFKRDSANIQKSLYIWGSVGRGKSMMMDLFYNSIDLPNKRRVHFHAFMQEVHSRIHEFRKGGSRSRTGADPVITLARDIAAETRLLCFDELQATDVADATLLYRLFDALFELGVTIVSTSNHPPVSLYTGGIQRERFVKFIQLLEANMKIASLSSQKDYRYLQLRSLQNVFYSPLDLGATAFITNTLSHLGITSEGKPDIFIVQGRTIPFVSYDDTIGRFSFAGLCEKPLGAADYLAIANRLDTVILTDIPQLSPEKRNEAKRFVTLIDTLYERKVRLIATASAKPEALYPEGDGSFEFGRTVSRLNEMQSAKYLMD
jgi:cell division protein ZapE